MNIGRAFTYAFDDPEIAGKLTVAAALGFVGVITMPLLLVGLVAWAALAGYLVDLVRNLHDHRQFPLPRWDNYAAKISKGGNVLAAGIVYNLPNLLFGCCLWATNSFWTEGVIGNTMSLVTLCCAVPLLIVYNLVTWPLLALGLSRYADENNIVTFFQFGDLLNTANRRLGVTAQWVAVMLIVNAGLLLLFLIPCIGWAIAPALGLPVWGYLAGQLAAQVDQPGK